MHRETFERDYGTGGEEEADRKMKSERRLLLFLSSFCHAIFLSVVFFCFSPPRMSAWKGRRSGVLFPAACLKR